MEYTDIVASGTRGYATTHWQSRLHRIDVIVGRLQCGPLMLFMTIVRGALYAGTGKEPCTCCATKSTDQAWLPVNDTLY